MLEFTSQIYTIFLNARLVTGASDLHCTSVPVFAKNDVTDAADEQPVARLLFNDHNFTHIQGYTIKDIDHAMFNVLVRMSF